MPAWWWVQEDGLESIWSCSSRESLSVSLIFIYLFVFFTEYNHTGHPHAKRQQGKHLSNHIQECFKTLQSHFAIMSLKIKTSWANCQALPQPNSAEMCKEALTVKKKSVYSDLCHHHKNKQKVIKIKERFQKESWEVPSKVMMPHVK